MKRLATATDRIAEVLYELARAGDLGACAYWLKHGRPERIDRFDRVTRTKLAVLKAALTRASANGRDRVEIRIGPDGKPMAVEAQPEQELVVVILPSNGREAPGTRLGPDPLRPTAVLRPNQPAP